MVYLQLATASPISFLRISGRVARSLRAWSRLPATTDVERESPIELTGTVEGI